MAHHDWLGLKNELPHRRKVLLTVMSFLIPLAVWCALSYIPGLWHPLVHVTSVGSVDYFVPDMDVPPAPEPMDFAAWMEVYLDGRWWTFDPRNNARRKGRVLIGRGRDAVDVAMVTTFGGPVLESMQVWAEEAA